MISPQMDAWLGCHLTGSTYLYGYRVSKRRTYVTHIAHGPIANLGGTESHPMDRSAGTMYPPFNRDGIHDVISTTVKKVFVYR